MSTFECVFEGCGRVFSRQARLEDHITTHTGERPYICPEPGCDKTFARQSYLTRHADTHSESRPHTCVTCNSSFKSVSNLRKHERTHEGRKLYPCRQCNVVGFTKKTHLYKHLLEVHGETAPYRCDMCDQSFTTQSHLTRHQKRIHYSLYMCTDCGEQFDKFSVLQKHIAQTHKKKRRDSGWCEECSIRFSTVTNLELHRRRVHGAENGSEQVEKKREVVSVEDQGPSSIPTSDVDELVEGGEIFEVEECRYPCPTCKKVFRSKSTLSCHLRRAHNVINIVEYECSECTKVFKHKPNLVKHIQSVHQGVKRFICEECPAGFFYKQAFERHVETVHRNPKKRKVTVAWNKKTVLESVTGHIEDSAKREYLEEMKAVPVRGS